MKHLHRFRRWLRYRRVLRFGLSGGAGETGTWNVGQVMGHRSNRSEPIDSVDDAGTERLAVDAKISGVSEINLDETSDEVAVFGGVDGSEVADAATRQIINVDSAGRVRVVGAAADGVAVVGNPVLVAGQDGTNTQSIKTDSTGAVEVISTAGINVTGNVAHDAVDSGNPVKVGGKATATAVTPPTAVASGDRVQAWFDAEGRQIIAAVGAQNHDVPNDANNRPLKQGGVAIAHGANPTAVAAADIVQFLANRAGIPFVIGGHPNIVSTEYKSTAAQTNVAILTVAAGAKIVVTGIQVTVDEATTVGVGMRMGFAAATLPALPADGATATGIVASHGGIVPGGGLVQGDGSGILGVGADGEDLRITHDVATSGDLRVVVKSYTVES